MNYNEEIKVVQNKTNTKYSIKRDELVNFVENYKSRARLCEEVDAVERKEGDEGILNGLLTDIKNGIDENSVESRRDEFGTNRKIKPPLKGFWKLLWEALEDFLLRILIVCALVVIIINYIPKVSHEDPKFAWIDGFAIFFAVFLSSGVTAINDYQKEKQFKALADEAENNNKTFVIRNGQTKQIHSDEIVVGDIVKIITGMEIPADGYIIQGNGIKCDESPMTGETKPMNKSTFPDCIKKREKIMEEGKQNTSSIHAVPSIIAISGTKVLDGIGLMIVIAVGKYSAIGKIKSQIEENDDELTPLQLKLDKIAKDIGYFGLYSGILIFIIITIRSIIEYSIGNYLNEDGTKNYSELIFKIVNALIIAITVLVVAIPEGLPLAVTISLAYSVKKMMKDNNLVRKLQACETMGGANIICSDKTGTLTKNEMYLTHFWNMKEHNIYDSQNVVAVELKNYTNKETEKILYESIIFNSNEDPDKKTGNPTELAILKYFHILNYNVVEDREKAKKLFMGNFSSDRKRMSTIVEIEGKYFCFMKGASELMLKVCNEVLDLEKGESINMDRNMVSQIEQAIVNMAELSLRTIGIVYKELDSLPDFENPDERGIHQYEKDGFKLVGVCGIKDVIRPEVPYAIEKCNEAGIQVKMVTGDNKITAKAISIEVGIIQKDDKDALVLEGPEFIEICGGLVCENCSDKDECDCVENEKLLSKDENKGKKVRKMIIKNKEAFLKIANKIKVIARSRPDDKLALVTGLKEMGHVIAVTGDGTNDAPALSKADVGFAMNIAGTQIAKDASDILLMDDNFKSIVEAVKWGRNIYDNIRKFLQFQLTVNIVAVVVTIISAAVTNVPIFTPVQMLWLNIIMDTFASLALATEPPHDGLLKRKPHGKNDYIINKKMMKHIFGQVIYQMFIVLLILFGAPKFLPAYRDSEKNSSGFVKIGGELSKSGDIPNDKYGADPSEHFTYNFNAFVMLQIFNFINARKLNDEFNTFEGILKSFMFILMIIIIFILQLIFLILAGKGVGVIQWGLGPVQWIICIIIGAFSLVVNLLLKCIPEEKLCIEFGKKKSNLKKSSTLNIRRSNHEEHIRKSIIQRESSHYDI